MSGFGGFGGGFTGATNSSNSGFGSFGANQSQGFGNFGTTQPAASNTGFTGFGVSHNAGAPASGFGTASGFGSTSAGNPPSGFGGFGGTAVAPEAAGQVKSFGTFGNNNFGSTAAASFGKNPTATQGKRTCKFWLQGKCRKGLDCNFAHSGDEPNQKPAPSSQTAAQSCDDVTFKALAHSYKSFSQPILGGFLPASQIPSLGQPSRLMRPDSPFVYHGAGLSNEEIVFLSLGDMNPAAAFRQALQESLQAKAQWLAAYKQGNTKAALNAEITSKIAEVIQESSNTDSLFQALKIQGNQWVDPGPLFPADLDESSAVISEPAAQLVESAPEGVAVIKIKKKVQIKVEPTAFITLGQKANVVEALRAEDYDWENYEDFTHGIPLEPPPLSMR